MNSKHLIFKLFFLSYLLEISCLSCSYLPQFGCDSAVLPRRDSPAVILDANKCVFGGLGNTVELLVSLHEIVFRAKRRLIWRTDTRLGWEDMFVYSNDLPWTYKKSEQLPPSPTVITSEYLINNNIAHFNAYMNRNEHDEQRVLSDRMLAGFWNVILNATGDVLVHVEKDACHLFNIPSVENPTIGSLIFKPTFQCPKKCSRENVLYFRTFAADCRNHSQHFSRTEMLKTMSMQSTRTKEDIVTTLSALCKSDTITVVSDSWKFKHLVKQLCKRKFCSEYNDRAPVLLTVPHAEQNTHLKSKILQVLCDLFTIAEARTMHVIHGQSYLSAARWFTNTTSASRNMIFPSWSPAEEYSGPAYC